MPHNPHDTDSIMVQDHTSRLSRLEGSFQKVLSGMATIEAITMGSRDDLQDIKSDVKTLKTNQEKLAVKVVGYEGKLKTLEDAELERKAKSRAFKKAAIGACGTIVASLLVWLLGFK